MAIVDSFREKRQLKTDKQEIFEGEMFRIVQK